MLRKVIKNNIKEEEQMKHILDELWEHILEFIANHKTSEKLFNFDGTEYKSQKCVF
jgi:uncharacterized membrane-anchored protein